MTTLKSDCRKFAPNIFNKSKCQNCFRTKDAHSAEALESNRATRKVSKCGYLFVAPDWDFSVSINRTKRWQRRWFVLYDDGELTYSVDEHPNTIPQALIDMNKVLEVSDAEQVTGNQFALAITAPEKVHFIKGTNRDESRWWYDVLSHYPHGTVRGKHKRNATYPAVHLTGLVKDENTPSEINKGIELECYPLHLEEQNEDELILTTPCNQMDNNQTVSSKKTEDIENLNNLIKSSYNKLQQAPSKREAKGIMVENKSDNLIENCKNNGSLDRHKGEDLINSEMSKSRRYVKRENRGMRSQRSRSDGVAKMIPSTTRDATDFEWPARSFHHNPVYLLFSEVPALKHLDTLGDIKKSEVSPIVRRRHTSDTGNTDKPSVKTESSLLLDAQADSEERLTSTPNCKIQNTESPLNTGSSIKSPLILECPPPRKQNLSICSSDFDTSIQARGDPDGCNLSPGGLPSPEIQIELNSEGLFVKKGWLYRLGVHKEWYKHWFVLKNSMLSYYRDPTAEDSGILDGILDLGLVKNVQQVASDRNYAFSVTTWDDKKHILAAASASVRSNWMQAVSRTANINADQDFSRMEETTLLLQKLKSTPSPVPSFDEPDRPTEQISSNLNHISSSSSSSSSSSDDHSEYFSVVDEEDILERAASPRALPPSPPVNRTAISRVKEKSRSRSSSRSRLSSRRLQSMANQDDDSIRKQEEVQSDENETMHRKSPIGELPSPTLVNTLCEFFESKDQIQEKAVALESKLEPEARNNPVKSNNYSYWDLTKKCNELKKQLHEKMSCNTLLQEQTRTTCVNDKPELLKLFVECRDFLCEVRSAMEVSKAVPDSVWGDVEKMSVEMESVLMSTSSCESEKADPNPKSEMKMRKSPCTRVSEAKAKIEKARKVIKRLKKELKESQNSHDDLELHCFKLKQDMCSAGQYHQSQMALMTARVDDLTSKLTVSERTLRQLKQKVSKLEARQERRRSSLKGKEAVSLSKEFEGKLNELEQKIGVIEMSIQSNDLINNEETNEDNKETEGSSKQSARLSEGSLNEAPTSMLLRLHSLDMKVKSVACTSEHQVVDLETPQAIALSQDMALINQHEKPKICLQIKKAEESEAPEECIDHWSSLSVTTSMSDLRTIDAEELLENPESLEECLDTLFQKLSSTMAWVQPALLNLAKKEVKDSAVITQLLEELSAVGSEDDSGGSVSSKCRAHLQSLHNITTALSCDHDKESVTQIVSHLSSIAQQFGDSLNVHNKQDLFSLLTPCKVKYNLEQGEDLLGQLDVLDKVVEQLGTQVVTFKSNLVQMQLDMLDKCQVSNTSKKNILADLRWDILRWSDSSCDDQNHILMELSHDLDWLEKVLDNNLDSILPSNQIQLIWDIFQATLVMSHLRHNAKNLRHSFKAKVIGDLQGSVQDQLVATVLAKLLFYFQQVISEEHKHFQDELNHLTCRLQELEEADEARHREGCGVCVQLQTQVCHLEAELKSCQRLSLGGAPCDRCRELHRKMEILSERHQRELAAAIIQEQAEKEALQEQQELLLREKNEEHEKELSKLQQDLEASQKNLHLLKDQFDEQLQSLQSIYEEKLQDRKEDFLEEIVLQKYQSEMEDLKSLCEKGLAAMEKSHRRTIQDLETHHHHQLSYLRTEKEKALAEETQATRAALEAIRRAHEKELEKELSRIKDDLLQKIAQEQGATVMKEHKAALEEIQREILSLSEKYSVKCLENAALEEKFRVCNQHLQQTNYQVLDLLARNKRLRGHLSSDLSQQREDLLQKNQHSVEYLKQLLSLRDSELVAEREDKAQLKLKLHQAQNELSLLDVRCQQLDQSLQAQRRLWQGETSTLKTRLEAIIAASAIDESCMGGEYLDTSVRRKPRRTFSLTTLRSRDLLRSPSCSTLAKTSTLL